MKKVFLIAVMAVACTAMMSAKDNQVKEGWNEFKNEVKASAPRAIGGNIGTGIGFSYQQGLCGGKNMLDIAANVPLPIKGTDWGIGAHITYDWINPFNTSIPWDEKGEWNWAMGVGAAGGIYGFNDVFWHVGVAGHVGIAYDFWFPMELSLDWRPEFGLSDKNINSEEHNLGFGFGGLYGISLGVRYLF